MPMYQKAALRFRRMAFENVDCVLWDHYAGCSLAKTDSNPRSLWGSEITCLVVGLPAVIGGSWIGSGHARQFMDHGQ